jgi:hypothetical protein
LALLVKFAPIEEDVGESSGSTLCRADEKMQSRLMVVELYHSDRIRVSHVAREGDEFVEEITFVKGLSKILVDLDVSSGARTSLGSPSTTETIAR